MKLGGFIFNMIIYLFLLYNYNNYFFIFFISFIIIITYYYYLLFGGNFSKRNILISNIFHILNKVMWIVN